MDILPKVKYFEYKKNMKSNIIFHIPHNEIRVPFFAKKDYLISREKITEEAILLADWRVLKLIEKEIKKNNYLKFNYSRIFLDVERFKEGDDVMDSVGMGMMYSNGYLNKNFRKISVKNKDKIKNIITSIIKSYLKYQKVLKVSLTKRLLS